MLIFWKWAYFAFFFQKNAGNMLTIRNKGEQKLTNLKRCNDLLFKSCFLAN